MISCDPSLIGQLLLITFIGSTGEIKEAERKLLEMQQNQDFLPNLMEIAKETSTPYNIRKSAILYTLTYCRNRQDKFKQQTLMNTTKFLFSQLAQDTLQLHLRRHLINTISYVLSFDKTARVKYVLYQECLLRCKGACEDLNNTNRIIFIGLAIQTVLIVSIHNTKELSEFIRASLLYFVEISLKLFESAENVISDNDSRDSLVSILQIMKIYSTSLKLYLKKIAYSDLQTVRQLFEPKLCLLLSKLWTFDLKQNLNEAKIIYYSCNNDWQMLEHYHSIKADYMQSFTIIIRTVFQYFKQPQTLSSHQLVNKPFVIPLLISSLENISSHCPHYKIKSSSLVKLIQEIMNYLIMTSKINYYFQAFMNKKRQLIENCLFKFLEFSPQDYSKIISDPKEFIYEMMQIIEMDPTEFLSNRKKEFDVLQQVEDVQNYTTLKTVAATLLYNCCKNIDGTLSQILSYIQKCFVNKQENKFTDSLLILILGILRDLICQRSQDSQNVALFLTKRLKQSPFPHPLANLNTVTQPEKQQTLEYLLTLLTIQKYLNRIKQPDPSILPTLYPIISLILTTKDIQQGIKISAYELVTVLVNRDLKNKYSLSFLRLANQLLLTISENSGKVLQMIYNLFKFKDDDIGTELNLVILTLNNLKMIIEREVLRVDLGDKDIISKSWNIISDIAQNKRFVDVLSEQIEETILSLSKYVDGKNHVEYEDDILNAVSSLIEIRKEVTPRVLEIFGIFPNLFFNKFECKFEQSFETLNLFIAHGSNALKQNIIGTKALLEVSIVSMNTKQYNGRPRSESYCCQGVLILQNLIIYCGQAFSKEIWEPIITALVVRLEGNKISGTILRANVVAAIALCLMIGFQNFTPEIYNKLLSSVIQYRQTLTDNHSNKLVVIALCNIFWKQKNSTLAIFETLLDVMKIIRLKQNHTEKTPMEDLEKQYENWLACLQNPLIKINENDLFRQMVSSMKSTDHQKFNSIMGQLSYQKKQFVKELLSTVKVNNQIRQIFKIKR